MEFNKFDHERFFKDKILYYLDAEELLDYNTKEAQGSKVTATIVKDGTSYASGKTNIGEKVVVKVLNVQPSVFAKFVPMETEVLITDVERCVVYGEYNNQLSITANVKKAK